MCEKFVESQKISVSLQKGFKVHAIIEGEVKSESLSPEKLPFFCFPSDPTRKSLNNLNFFPGWG